MKFAKVLTTAFAFAASLFSIHASADYSRDQLQEFSAAENSWAATSANVANFGGDIGVYITDKNAVRINTLPQSFSSVAELDVPKLRRFNSKILGLWCDSHRAIFSRAKKEGQIYSMKMHVSPFSLASKTFVNGSSIQSFENSARVVSFWPKLNLAADSISASETGINKAEFEKSVSNQLSAQIQSIQNTGDAVLDLTGWDDVACDLFSGAAKLNVGITLSYEAPRVHRTQVLNEQQVKDLYYGSKAIFNVQSSLPRNYIISAVSLGASIVTKLNKAPTDFAFDDLFRAYSSLFELKTGVIKHLDNANYVQLSSDLDHLSRGDNTATPNVITTVVIPNR